MDLTGVVLDGRYHVLEPIAEGAMGVVYRAERLKLGRIVAVKVLHDELPDEISSRKRFEIEAMAMAKLEHPHCAAVVDVGIHENKPYVVMDFVSGENLKSLVAQGPVPPARAVELMRQVLSGLAHAHELGIIHRDIKPANIVLSQKAGLGDQVKILDFGLARFAAQASRLTVGIAVGTPSYMAPEQGRGAAVDARTDIYACGVMLYELLAGQKPFHSVNDDPVEIVRMHLLRPPPRLGPEFGELADVVAKALAKAPEDRFQSAEEFAAALRAAGGASSASQPVLRPPRAESQPVPRAESQPGPRAESQPVPRAASQPVPRAETQPPLGSQPVAMPRAESQPVIAYDATIAARPAQVKVAFRPTPRRLAIGGGSLLVLIIVIAAVTHHGGRDSAKSLDAGAGVADPSGGSAEPPKSAAMVEDTLAHANELIAAGRHEEALKVLAAGRQMWPANTQLPLMAGKLYFAKLWFSDGLAAFRAAVKNDPGIAADPELLKVVLRGFITTPSYEPELAAFLRDVIGTPAAAALAETAKDHPNATVRARAAAELKRY